MTTTTTTTTNPSGHKGEPAKFFFSLFLTLRGRNGESTNLPTCDAREPRPQTTTTRTTNKEDSGRKVCPPFFVFLSFTDTTCSERGGLNPSPPFSTRHGEGSAHESPLTTTIANHNHQHPHNDNNN